MADPKTIADLKPDHRNARQRTARSGDMIGRSLQEVGAARSIVIDENNVILAGNGTVEAAGQVGIERVRVVEADGEEIIAVRRSGLSAEQKRRLAYFDNRTGELAEWDVEQIAEDLADGFDLEGVFYPKEVDDLAASLHPDWSDGQGSPGSDAKRQTAIRPVFTVDDIETVERAIRATGEANRAKAVLAIFRHYIEGSPAAHLEGVLSDA